MLVPRSTFPFPLFFSLFLVIRTYIAHNIEYVAAIWILKGGRVPAGPIRAAPTSLRSGWVPGHAGGAFLAITMTGAGFQHCQGWEAFSRAQGTPPVENYPTPEASSTPIEKHHAFFIKILSTSVN